jgi:hypothetical protein
MEFILTIDTEGDNQWDHGRELASENIKYIPRFQELCNKYDIKPTYLITSEVCDDEYAKRIFSEYISQGKAEVGAHLHAWTTPPFMDNEGYRFNDENHPFANELPESLIIEKVRYLTSQIEASFGKRPVSFRSGRYGFNGNIARILSENSYIVDSSVTPYTNWALSKGMPGGKGGPDFSDKLPFPYFYYFAGSSLLEIPVTILPTVYPLTMNNKVTQYYFRHVDKILFLRQLKKYIFKDQPLWLRPFEWTTDNLFKELVDEAARIKLPFLVMMFHSSELMPGCSIYRKDKDAIERLYKQLTNFFSFLIEKDVTSSTLSEAAVRYRLIANNEK